MNLGSSLAERRLLPDSLVRFGIRRLLRKSIREMERETEAERQVVLADLVAIMDSSPIAPATAEANRQHYEVPPEFFELVLGRRLKYSSGFWPAGTANLDEAEAAMLERTCEHAGIEDGMRVLDLGSGWGSCALWVAEHYPGCRVQTVSGSAAQQTFIENAAQERGLANVRTRVGDMNDFAPGESYDRIVSIEMFEHMRNWRQLLRRIRGWLEPEGRLLVHHFCHRRWPYTFEDEGYDAWMARHCFTGGLMPSEDLLALFDEDLEIERRWSFSGEHYERTLEAWLRRLDRHEAEAIPILEQTYGKGSGAAWFQRWRLFILACSELFALHRGQEWWVGHYLLKPRG